MNPNLRDHCRQQRLYINAVLLNDELFDLIRDARRQGARLNVDHYGDTILSVTVCAGIPDAHIHAMQPDEAARVLRAFVGNITEERR